MPLFTLGKGSTGLEPTLLGVYLWPLDLEPMPGCGSVIFMGIPEHQTLYVDTSSGLTDALSALAGADEVYLDLEADSLHHYHAKICLLQVHVDNRVYLIDPLAGLELQPLLQVLAKKSLVFHGGDYDLRMLFQEHGFKPREIFDTMVAAQLLGFSAFGLASLVQERFGIILNKDHQKADWSRRPMDEELRAYASQDTVFLPGLKQWLTDGLNDLGRLAWHKQACDALIKATQRLKEPEDDDEIWRIHGSAKLYPRQLAVLRSLWFLREAEAKERDLPSFKICPSELMMRLAMAMPAEGRPQQWPNLPSRWSETFRQAIEKALEEAVHLPQAQWPSRKPLPKRPIKHPDPELLVKLREARDEVAKALALEPSLLAPRATMTAAALTGCKSAEAVKGAVSWLPWQEELLLDKWLAFGKGFRSEASR